MKVKELIEILNECNPESLVVLSRDEEGNGYEEARAVNSDEYNYDPEQQEIGLKKLTPELKKLGYSEEDLMEEGVEAVIIWP